MSPRAVSRCTPICEAPGQSCATSCASVQVGIAGKFGARPCGMSIRRFFALPIGSPEPLVWKLKSVTPNGGRPPAVWK